MVRLSSPVLFALALLVHPVLAQAPPAVGVPTGAPPTCPTLEQLFPEDGLFGPQATGMAFSADGAFAAWLYRPLRERRHGNDLWLYDVANDRVQRLTSVTVMARFQREARKVRADRIERARKAIAKESGTAKPAGGSEPAGAASADPRLSGDWVTDDDFEQKQAPRYDGIAGFDWSPTAAELLVSAGGDIYRYVVADQRLERFTQTREPELRVQWLPDGKGFTYMRGSALLRVTLGSHVVEQIDPRVPAGETVGSYELSPDGRALAFVTSKGEVPGGGRKVNIVSYRDRFATVREVPRTVSDDPLPEQTVSFYVVELADALGENGTLGRVFQHKVTGPRDVFRTPEWSPDSAHVAFSVFDQGSEQVRVLVADRASATKAEPEAPAARGASPEDRASAEVAEAKKEGEPVDRPARVVYRFLHAGGPTTPAMIRPQFLADNRRLVLVTEQTGFRHVHVLDPLYEQLDQLTRGRFEVHPVELAKDRKTLFVTATRDDAAFEDVFAVGLEDGSFTRLNASAGSWSHVAVSPDGGTVLGTYATFGRAPELNVVRIAAATQKELTDSHPEATRQLIAARPTFFTYTNRHGHVIHGHMFKPADQAPGDKRPLLVYVYGGPLGTRKTVEDGSYHTAAYLFARYMSERHGWVTCSIDPRGQSGYGSVFEKANFEQVGKPQVEDLVDGVAWFVANHDVDGSRVALHGWSFGGFQTQMCLYTEPRLFAAGIAGAGPTEWENYNHWYSQGTIGRTRPGTADLKKFSLLPLAKNLQAHLLLVHGMEDSNVLYQDTVRVYRELLGAGKEALVDLFLDPTGGHALGGDVKNLNRFRKYESFLLTWVGEGKKGPGAAGPAAASAPGESAKKRIVY